ncbi:hypothetical protein VPHD479_0373 [Vibrio phage D479]
MRLDVIASHRIVSRTIPRLCYKSPPYSICCYTREGYRVVFCKTIKSLASCKALGPSTD